jgi:hypothetical protein
MNIKENAVLKGVILSIDTAMKLREDLILELCLYTISLWSENVCEQISLSLSHNKEDALQGGSQNRRVMFKTAINLGIKLPK